MARAAAPRDYYARPGMMTDPGEHAALLRDLPTDIPGLCEVVQGLLLHVHWAVAYGFEIPADRMDEVEVRPAQRMLARIRELDPGPLDVARPVERRMLGNCRDFSTLLCTLLRHRGVPARARCGFGAYFQPGKFEDHWVCEHWSETEARWVKVDAQLDALQLKVLKPDFDPRDVPANQFIVAGQAWQACRAGREDPGSFGIFDMRGMWFVSGNVFRDLAALNRIELLPWDGWGLLDTAYAEYGDAELALHDRIAELTTNDGAWTEMLALYEERLRVPPVISSYTQRGVVKVELPG